MADFAQQVSDGVARQRLGRALSGRGAFLRFKKEPHQEYTVLVSVWQAFRDAGARRRAVGWLLDQRLIPTPPLRTLPPATPISSSPDSTAVSQVPQLPRPARKQPRPVLRRSTASDCLSPLQLKRLIAVFGRVHRVPIKLENVGIAVRDLEATIAFFEDLGLTVLGRDTVSGEWTDTAVGLDGNHAKIAMLQTPDGNGRLELFEYIHPDAIETEPTQPNQIGMHRVAFSVDDIDEALEVAARHGCHPLRGVATYEDVYKLTYVRGPSGIIVMLAEELNNS